MIELTGNLWNYHAASIPICITVNGAIRRDGACVMGRGLAKQAAQKFPQLPYTIGMLFKQREGMRVCALPEYCMFTFPVKYHWSDTGDLDLIELSGFQLKELVDGEKFETVALPRPGCGNGRLKWEDVKPRLHMLDDRFEVVEWKP
jgi:hypothetical protein